jgi:hypothetical protein
MPAYAKDGWPRVKNSTFRHHPAVAPDQRRQGDRVNLNVLFGAEPGIAGHRQSSHFAEIFLPECLFTGRCGWFSYWFQYISRHGVSGNPYFSGAAAVT